MWVTGQMLCCLFSASKYIQQAIYTQLINVGCNIQYCGVMDNYKMRKSPKGCQFESLARWHKNLQNIGFMRRFSK